MNRNCDGSAAVYFADITCINCSADKIKECAKKYKAEEAALNLGTELIKDSTGE